MLQANFRYPALLGALACIGAWWYWSTPVAGFNPEAKVSHPPGFIPARQQQRANDATTSAGTENRYPYTKEVGPRVPPKGPPILPLAVAKVQSAAPRPLNPVRTPYGITFRTASQAPDRAGIGSQGTLENPASRESSPLTLDFGLRSQLPVILIAPPAEATLVTPPVAVAETAILQDFLGAVTDASTGAGTLPTPETKDQQWDNAVIRADQRYRVLLGKEAFQRRSLEAARATLAAQVE